MENPVGAGVGEVIGAEKLPKRIARIVDRCTAGERVVKTISRAQGDFTEPVYHYEPSGASIGQISARRAIDMGAIAPLDDGLFGSETSQSYGVRK